MSAVAAIYVNHGLEKCAIRLARSEQEARSMILRQAGVALQPLRQRLMQRSAQDSATVLETSLLNNEKNILTEDSLKTLNKLVSEISQTDILAKSDLQKRAAKVKNNEQVLMQKQTVSLLEVLVFSYEVVELANALALAKDNPMTPLELLRDPDEWQTWKNLQERYTFIVNKRKLVPLPVLLDLSIRDLNEAQAYSLALIGLRIGKTEDGKITRYPKNFYGHDVQHALQGTSFFTPDIWQQFFAEIATWSDREHAAAHALVFDMTHESTGLMYEFKAYEYTIATWSNLGNRLQNEDFYGELVLAEVVDLKSHFEQVAAKIDRLILKIKPAKIGMKSIPPYVQ